MDKELPIELNTWAWSWKRVAKERPKIGRLAKSLQDGSFLDELPQETTSNQSNDIQTGANDQIDPLEANNSSSLLKSRPKMLLDPFASFL